MNKNQLLFWGTLIAILIIIGVCFEPFVKDDLCLAIIKSTLISIVGAGIYFLLSDNEKGERIIKSIIIAALPILIEVLVIIVSIFTSIVYLFKCIFDVIVSGNGYHG